MNQMFGNGIYWGVVEERCNDKHKLGRCKVRIAGIHTEDEKLLPTNDLPWAYPLVNNSGAMNGIGQSPTGYVEGTWVMVVFRDLYQQQPVIIGAVGGIPTEAATIQNIVFESQVQESTVTSGTGVTVTDGSGNPVLSSSTLTPNTERKVIRQPGVMTLSAEGKKWLKENEGLASLSATSIKIGTDAVAAATKIYAYKDSGGVWTIGWGNTYLSSGQAVKEGDTITKAEADSLFDQTKEETIKNVNRDLKIPVTQSMFEALVDMSYNMGHSGLTKSAMFSSLNSGKYEEAAALIESTRATVKGKANEGLKNRRLKERAWFLRDGIPSRDLSYIKETPEEQESAVPDATQNPAVRSSSQTTNGSPGTYTPGSVIKETELKNKKTKGFQDPNKKYPKKDWMEESDTHRLARHQNIDRTIVKKKESARVTDIKTARKETWNQPKIPYNARYPYNQAYVSESGHVEEFDDTEGNERLHWYHTKGTFEEIDTNGTSVRRIVGDDYEILERNGYVLIKGNCFVTIKGDSRVRIENDAYLEVLGNSYTDVTGNMEVSVKGDYKVKAYSIKMEAWNEDVDITAKQNISLDSGVSTEDPEIEPHSIYLNSKMAAQTGLKLPEEEAPGNPEFGELTVPDRTNETDASFESPDEGDSTEFIFALLESGALSPEQIQPQVIQEVPPGVTPKETVTPAEPKEMPKSPPTKSCDLIYETEVFTDGFALTDGWTLGDVCKGTSGIPNGVNYGKTAQEIVCNLKTLTENVIVPVKKRYPNMLITNSWRSEAVNSRLTGASKTSQHLTGEAVDIQFSGFNRKQTYDAAIEIQKLLPEYDQMLLEYKGTSMWLHISFKASGGNRNEIRTIDVFNKANNVNGAFKLYGA